MKENGIFIIDKQQINDEQQKIGKNMSKKLIALIGVPVGIIFISIIVLTGSYNSLVSKDESVKQANSKIEVALQRRG